MNETDIAVGTPTIASEPIRHFQHGVLLLLFGITVENTTKGP